MALNLFDSKGIPIEDQHFTWRAPAAGTGPGGDMPTVS